MLYLVADNVAKILNAASVLST